VAAQWYQRAANARYAPAEFNLGLLYETGLGVQQNWITAAQWIDAAAQQGLQPAVLERNYVTNTALRVKHAQEVAAQQQRGSGSCKPFYQMGAMGTCVPGPALMIESMRMDNARTAD